MNNFSMDRIKALDKSMLESSTERYYYPINLTADEAAIILGISPDDFVRLAKTAIPIAADWCRGYIFKPFNEDSDEWKEPPIIIEFEKSWGINDNLYYLIPFYYTFIIDKRHHFRMELLLMREGYAKASGKPMRSRREAKRLETHWFRRCDLSKHTNKHVNLMDCIDEQFPEYPDDENENLGDLEE